MGDRQRFRYMGLFVSWDLKQPFIYTNGIAQSRNTEFKYRIYVSKLNIYEKTVTPPERKSKPTAWKKGERIPPPAATQLTLGAEL